MMQQEAYMINKLLRRELVQNLKRKWSVLFYVLFIFFLPLTLVLGEVCAEDNVGIQAQVAVPPPQPVVAAAPPQLEIAAPPDVVVVPSEQYPNQYGYMLPDMEGVSFYQGAWYRYYNGAWYGAPTYNAVWEPVHVYLVPPVVVSIWPEYPLFLPVGYYRIHYADYHEHWRAWERDRHWNNYSWYKHEMRADVRKDRMAHMEARRAEMAKERTAPTHERHIVAHQSLGKESAENKKPGIAATQKLGQDENKRPHIASRQSLGKESVENKKSSGAIDKKSKEAAAARQRKQQQPQKSSAKPQPKQQNQKAETTNKK